MLLQITNLEAYPFDLTFFLKTSLKNVSYWGRLTKTTALYVLFIESLVDFGHGIIYNPHSDLNEVGIFILISQLRNQTQSS